MFGIINFEAFLIAAILLNLTPGSDTMYILGRSISQGKKAGVLSALGISTGSLIHTIFAALGLSIVIAQSAAAFNLIKYLGALYLIYLGVRTLTSKKNNDFQSAANSKLTSNRNIFLSGIVTNVLNPKVALFYLAFLPQFIDLNYANSTTVSFLILGLTFVTTGTIWCLILALFAAKLASRIKENSKIKVWLDRFTGIVFICLGVKLALLKK